MAKDAKKSAKSSQQSAPTPVVGGATAGLTPEQTKSRESKLSKMIVRSVFGTAMMVSFGGIIWLGHIYIIIMLAWIQVGLFRELVNVRNKRKEDRIGRVPLFRTIQWLMFFVAMYYMYFKVFLTLGLEQSILKQLPEALSWRLAKFVDYHTLIVFVGYVFVFVALVLSLRPGLYKFQIQTFTWTIAVLCLIVYQVKGATVLIFEGLFWFILPCALVIFNDIAAYFCGMSFGKKFVSFPLTQLSPNKTWEGFIGAAFFTVVFGWYFSDFISNSTWTVCRQHEVMAWPSPLECEIDDVFVKQVVHFPYEDLSLFTVFAKPVQVHAVALACFASVIAPMGGLLASAIKRAYDLKDFDVLIPGHGGFMDRMDCQFLMLLCTYVHYRTFMKKHDFTADQLLGIIRTLQVPSQDYILRNLADGLNRTLAS
uniref:phosphatidate cytidylyltransferase n=1 Tax=Noctiluca scintillans TaxID=2966 RepID=A0A7S1F9U0_NOCSC